MLVLDKEMPMERIGISLSYVFKMVKQYGKISWLKFEAHPSLFAVANK
ncbi:hypothetical protein [Priestia megaterium]